MINTVIRHHSFHSHGTLHRPVRHQPLDPDGTIPSNHLHNFEHSSISMTFFLYAACAIILDRAHVQAQFGLTQLLGAIAFAQELLLFHFHSTDHMGPEGQYHLMFQILVLVSLSTTLISIGLPSSFLVSFVRSLSIFSQGLWEVVMGFMLWTPSLVPKGCFLNDEDGHMVVRCSSHDALHRANSLVNIEFSWFIIAVTVFAVSFYLVLLKPYGEKVQYFWLGNEDEESNDDVESLKSGTFGNNKSFIHMGKISSQNDMER
ncbi:transmembrane protein 45B [Spatholobus suberectus]|nr:transmembrane protein 45B [Spatholobus suberectus]